MKNFISNTVFEQRGKSIPSTKHFCDEKKNLAGRIEALGSNKNSSSIEEPKTQIPQPASSFHM